MVKLSTALNSIDEAINGYLNPMITSNTIEEIVFGTKDRKTPKTPYIRVAYLKDAVCNNTTIGTGTNREEWDQQVHIGCVVKELESPQQGFRDARAILSDARGYLLADRQFGLPNIVRKVDSTNIKTVPYPMGKKMSLYGAGTVLNINFIINNE